MQEDEPAGIDGEEGAAGAPARSDSADGRGGVPTPLR